MYLYKKTIKSCSLVKEATLATALINHEISHEDIFYKGQNNMFGNFPIHSHFNLAAVVTYCLQWNRWYTKLVPSQLLKQDESTNYLHYWSSVTLLQAQRSYSWQWYWPGRGWCTPAGVRQCRRRCTCLQQQCKQQRTWHSLRCWLWRRALGSPSETYLQAHRVTICTGTSHQRSHCFYSQNTNL